MSRSCFSSRRSTLTSFPNGCRSIKYSPERIGRSPISLAIMTLWLDPMASSTSSPCGHSHSPNAAGRQLGSKRSRNVTSIIESPQFASIRFDLGHGIPEHAELTETPSAPLTPLSPLKHKTETPTLLSAVNLKSLAARKHPATYLPPPRTSSPIAQGFRWNPTPRARACPDASKRLQ
jgi:hypothetical protein